MEREGEGGGEGIIKHNFMQLISVLVGKNRERRKIIIIMAGENKKKGFENGKINNFTWKVRSSYKAYVFKSWERKILFGPGHSWR